MLLKTILFSSCEPIQPMRNSIKAESLNHSAHSSFQEKVSPEYVYPEKEEIPPYINSNSMDSSPVNPILHSSFSTKFQDSFERDVPESEPFPETPTGSSSSKEHFSPKCAFAPPCVARTRCERPTAIRMLPKGGKSRVSDLLKLNIF